MNTLSASRTYSAAMGGYGTGYNTQGRFSRYKRDYYKGWLSATIHRAKKRIRRDGRREIEHQLVELDTLRDDYNRLPFCGECGATKRTCQCKYRRYDEEFDYVMSLAYDDMYENYGESEKMSFVTFRQYMQDQVLQSDQNNDAGHVLYRYVSAYYPAIKHHLTPTKLLFYCHYLSPAYNEAMRIIHQHWDERLNCEDCLKPQSECECWDDLYNRYFPEPEFNDDEYYSYYEDY